MLALRCITAPASQRGCGMVGRQRPRTPWWCAWPHPPSPRTRCASCSSSAPPAAADAAAQRAGQEAWTRLVRYPSRSTCRRMMQHWRVQGYAHRVGVAAHVLPVGEGQAVRGQVLVHLQKGLEGLQVAAHGRLADQALVLRRRKVRWGECVGRVGSGRAFFSVTAPRWMRLGSKAGAQAACCRPASQLHCRPHLHELQLLPLWEGLHPLLDLGAIPHPLVILCRRRRLRGELAAHAHSAQTPCVITGKLAAHPGTP